MQSPPSAEPVAAESRDSAPLADVYALYLQTIEKVSDRRGALNTWMLGLLNAMIAFDAATAKLSQNASDVTRGLLVPLAGVATALIWMALLTSYRDLNRAKFRVLFTLEEAMGLKVFRLEQQHYKEVGRRGFARLEKYVPLAFMAIFAAVLAARIF